MRIAEFIPIVEKIMLERPVWFGLESDRVGTEDDLRLAESQLGVRLPESYREFVARFGGGYFAFGNVFSVDPSSEWYIVDRNKGIERGNFVAVSDNGVGDLYGFEDCDGVCNEKLVMLDVTGRALIVEPACFRLTCCRSRDVLLHR